MHAWERGDSKPLCFSLSLASTMQHASSQWQSVGSMGTASPGTSYQCASSQWQAPETRQGFGLSSQEMQCNQN